MTPGVPGTPLPRQRRFDSFPEPHVEEAPLPSPPRPPGSWRPSRSNAPQWAAGLVAVIGALGGAGGLAQLMSKSDEQIRQQAAILAKLDNLAEAQKKDGVRLDAIEHRERQNFSRSETAFATLFAALAQEGYQPPRDAPAQVGQVEFRSTENAAQPVQATAPDGRALAIPKPAPPPP